LFAALAQGSLDGEQHGDFAIGVGCRISECEGRCAGENTGADEDQEAIPGHKGASLLLRVLWVAKETGEDEAGLETGFRPGVDRAGKLRVCPKALTVVLT
jgi:hypothetical protein